MARTKVSAAVSQYITNRRAESPYHFVDGNGSPTPPTLEERLVVIEEDLQQIQNVLKTQLKRMADMQVLIDRLTRPPHSRT